MRIADWSPTRTILLNLHRCTANPIKLSWFLSGRFFSDVSSLDGMAELNGHRSVPNRARVLKFVGPDTFSWDFVPGRMGIVFAL